MSLVIIANNKLGYPAKESGASLSHNYNHKYWIYYRLLATAIITVQRKGSRVNIKL